MKKLLSIFLAMTMAVSAFACTFAVSADTTDINFNDGDMSMVTIIGDATAEIDEGKLKVYWENLWDGNLELTNYARIAVDTTDLTNLTFDAYVAEGVEFDGATNRGAHIGIEIDGTVYWDTTYNSGHIQHKDVTHFEILNKTMFNIPEKGFDYRDDKDENAMKKMTAEDIANIDAICIRPAQHMKGQFTYIDNISAPAPSSGNTEEINFNAQVALYDSIDLSILPDVESTEGVTATFKVDGKVVSEGVEAVEGKYTYPCVNPGEMGKDVTVELYREGTLIGTTTTSVAAYLKTLIADETQNSQTKDLAFATLEYGAAAQTYLGDTAELVTDGVEYTYSTDKLTEDCYSNDYFKETISDYDETDITAAWLNLSNSIAIKFKVETSEPVDNIYLRVETGDVFSEVAHIKGEQKQGYIEFTFDELNPSQGSDGFVFTVCDNSHEQISNSVFYSVESYAARMYSNVDNANMKNLIAATMNYCFFAELYAKNQ